MSTLYKFRNNLANVDNINLDPIAYSSMHCSWLARKTLNEKCDSFFPRITETQLGGGGILPKKLGRSVRPVSHYPYSIYDCVYIVAVNIFCEGLLLLVLPNLRARC